ncbi:hypothetical protein H4217_000466 [Coemansia sp. RSA 1939]|nr:hypothetical protein H4217_000466 [Coemansia sp. RSA 1939]KAJ2615983.1 hypothetical protein EV177_001301 [Coemansia sp. RSA 1804]
MKAFSILTVLAAAAAAAASGASIASEVLGEPLFIYVKGPGETLTSGLSSSSSSEQQQQQQQQAADTEAEAAAVSSAPAEAEYTTPAAPTTSAYEEPAATSSAADEAGTGDEQASSGGAIPDGQGNKFNVPSGGVRFPWNYGNSDKVVPITPGSTNGGWAMSPNQACTPGTWCPYACESGYYSAQWDPSALLYNGAGSMNGGLFADASGKLTKPYPSKPFCAPGMFNAYIKNTLAQPVSACQTIYPGNEAMLIPTVAQGNGGTAPLNVVPSSYWLGTSSQFYVNLAGSTDAQCIWGTAAKAVGNWGPYIFGAGQSKDGNTYISLQYNPLYLSVGFKAADTYNVRIECASGACNFPTGGKCQCEKGVCSVDNGCTVTLTGDAKANFVIY